MPVSLDFHRSIYPSAKRGLGAAERAQRATTLDPALSANGLRRARADPATVASLLSALVTSVDGRDVRALLDTEGVAIQIVGLEPGSPNATVFDEALAEFLTTVGPDGRTVTPPGSAATRSRLTAMRMGVSAETARKMEPPEPWYVAERRRLARVLGHPAVARAVRGEGELPPEVAEQVGAWTKLARTLASSTRATKVKQAAEVVGAVALAAQDALGGQVGGPRMRRVGKNHYAAPGYQPRRRATNRVTAVASPTGQKSDWIDPAEAEITADSGVRRRSRRT